jgi:glycogen debranching enzyme
LWILLLHDAWLWGLPDHVVIGMSGNLRRAVDWLRASADASHDGFLRYNDPTGRGLSNQGWKDSHDAMRRRDGSIGEAPIALLEVQAYAVQAAHAAADLNERLLGESGDELRTWAEALSERVRRHFWVADAEGRYLAMALDRNGTPVDGVASNMGHVLGTGLLTAPESAEVAARLTSPDLLGPFGIGTLGRRNPAYNPIGYHTGSVWVHDATICARGLAADGHAEAAGATLRALLEGAMHFDFRLPELYGADPSIGKPAPYPASCRPQAWSAASAVAMVTTALGLEPDVPCGRLTVRPLRPSPFGALRVSGIRVGEHTVTVEVDSAGRVVSVEAPDSLTVDVPG